MYDSEIADDSEEGEKEADDTINYMTYCLTIRIYMTARLPMRVRKRRMILQNT